jgi:DNA-binding Xre family transcriptional regulator
MATLSELLENRGKKLTDLAESLGVNKSTVSRWNANGVPVKRLEDIETAVGIPACDLRPDYARVFVKTRAQ